MDVKKSKDAQAFAPPRHTNVEAFMLQGGAATAANFAAVILSRFEPGGTADFEAAPIGKIYVMLDGVLEVTVADGTTASLRPNDSCFLAPGEGRSILNPGPGSATMLVIVPPPAPAS
jgi:quercetin dioxygenase-like cupin family protein